MKSLFNIIIWSIGCLNLLENEVPVLIPDFLVVDLGQVVNKCADIERIVDSIREMYQMNRNNFDVDFVPWNCVNNILN